MSGHLTGTVRFSVESLLYYAPKITSTGDALATAVDRVQRQLAGLGDFFGNSWPDEPFRNSYPRCQWALLIIARQIANEIQGIGGGIEQMARTYGIAEDQNTADVHRIQGNESRTAARINHAGGLPAPPGPAADPTVLNPAPPKSANPFRPAPDPTPNPAPAPPASISTTSAAVPAEVTASSFVARPSSLPAGPVMPEPQPGVDPTTWQPRDAMSLLGPWPSGDPNRMDEAAGCWKALTVALDDAWTDLQRYTAYVMAEAQGPAADTFQDYVDKLTGRGHGLLFRAIEMSENLQKTCTQQADSIREIKRQLEETLIEIAATFVIGQVLSVLTFGDAEVATAAIETGVADRFTSLVTRFVQAGGAIENALNTTAEGLGKIAGAAIVGGGQSALIGAADLAATNAIGRAFGDKPVTGTAALKAVAEDAAIGTILGQGSASGLLGLSAAAASERLIALGQQLKTEADGDRSAGPALMALGSELKDGSITVSAANAAATQLITQHQITPVTFITGTVSNRFTTAISPHVGRHSKL